MGEATRDIEPDVHSITLEPPGWTITLAHTSVGVVFTASGLQTDAPNNVVVDIGMMPAQAREIAGGLLAHANAVEREAAVAHG